MPYSTLREAITQVARNMSLVNGQNMTPYSDDTVISYLVAAHEHIMGESEWSEMVVWRVKELDGVQGLVTVLFDDIDDWKDISRIYHELYQTPLPVLTSYTNPLFNPAFSQGYRGLPDEEDNAGPGKYLVKFYPATLTGKVLFQYHKKMDFSDDKIKLPVDWWLHVYYASWMYACDDGTNPVQIDKYIKQAQRRMGQVMAKENSRHSPTNPGNIVPSMWWEEGSPYS